MPQIRFASINIERSKHLEKVIPFIREYQPDVLALQELVPRDIACFEKELNASGIYAPLGLHPDDTEARTPILIGTMLFTKLPFVEGHVKYYVGSAQEALYGQCDTKQINRPLVSIEVEKENTPFRFITTHFTWTPNGLPDDAQRQDMTALLSHLETEKEFILAGDFNAPRGGEIFARLAEKYTDNIPPHYKTSIDLELHKAGKLRPEELADKMVDGLFTTPAYVASEVTLHSGVSDHMAITATLSHVAPDARAVQYAAYDVSGKA